MCGVQKLMESAVPFIVIQMSLFLVIYHILWAVFYSFNWKHIFLCTAAGVQKSLKQKHGKNVDFVNSKLLPIKWVLKLLLNLINGSLKCSYLTIPSRMFSFYARGETLCPQGVSVTLFGIFPVLVPISCVLFSLLPIWSYNFTLSFVSIVYMSLFI